MKKVIILLGTFLIVSCIPTRIAPTIKDHKIMVAKKFKRNLPKQHAFIFEDTKDANEFYNYINTKYQLDNQNVEYNVPVKIDNKTYYLSFYETEIPTKTINLVPIAIDASLEAKGHDPLLKDAEFSRVGKWYLALTVSDDDMKDCIASDYKSQQKVLRFLKELKNEYLATHNYIEVLLKK